MTPVEPGLSPDATLVLIAAYPGRGVLQPHVDKLLPSLVARGYRVEFLGWDRSSRWPKRFSYDGVDYRMILRGGGYSYSSRTLFFLMPVWYLAATWRLLRRSRKRGETIMALDFEGALPAALAGIIRGGKFIYNCRDNISMRYRLPSIVKKLVDVVDGWVMAQAEAVIFPDESRVPTGGKRPAGCRSVIVPSSAPDVDVVDRRLPSVLTIYAMGNLRRDRGIDLLLDALVEAPECRVLVAGKCRDPELTTRLRSDDRVDFRGELSPTAALELCGEADVLFTFYSPDLEINRRAVSNKWADAMMAARPIVVNEEVTRSAWVEQESIGYRCPYRLDALTALMRRLADDRDDLLARGARGRALWETSYRWNVAEAQIVDLIERAAFT